MARSRIGEEQVIDGDFLSVAEHNNPVETPHYFLNTVDSPTTYSGYAGQVLVVNTTEDGISFSEISSDMLITLNNHINDTSIHFSIVDGGSFI